MVACIQKSEIRMGKQKLIIENYIIYSAIRWALKPEHCLQLN